MGKQLSHHVHVIRYKKSYLKYFRFGSFEQHFLGWIRLVLVRAGAADNEHEVILATSEGDDVREGEPVRHLHGVVVKEGQALFVDSKPHQFSIIFILKWENKILQDRTFFKVKL